MTYDEDTPARTENDAVAELALRAAEAITLEPGGYHVIHDGKGGLTTYDLTGDKWRDTPKRITDHVEVGNVATLLNYWTKYSDEWSEMWADPDKRTLTAIIDAHTGTDGSGGDADWQGHRATLTLALSEPLIAWMTKNLKPLSQEDFGEFIEDQMPHILTPTGAELMELVHGLEVNQTAEFKSGVRLKTGARQIHYAETVEGRTRQGSVEVPDHITLRLPIWHGDDDSHELTATLRFRPNVPRQGQVALLYKLAGVRELLDGAFAALVGSVETEIGRPVYYGTPAPAAA